MKRRENILRADRYYAAREKLDKRETHCFVGLLGSMAVGVALELIGNYPQSAGVREVLTIGRDIAVSGAIGSAAFGMHNSYRQSWAKDYVRAMNTGFQDITGALATEAESPEDLQLLKLDSAFTELSGSTPVTTEGLE